MNWLKDILDVNNNETNSLEFLKFVKSDFDLFTEKVYCFTPNGDAITLPYGSTPIDFAYMIYSAIGNKMVGAKVNIVLVTIDYKIKNGDRISIITSGNSNGPSRDWLSIIKSPQARTKILHWFKQEGRDKNIALGKDIVDKYIKSKKYKQEDLFKTEYVNSACKKFTCQTLDDLYATVDHGDLKESQLVAKLKEEYDKEHAPNITDEDVLKSVTNLENGEDYKKCGIIVKGIKDLAVRYGKCCSPVPGDEIIGFITRGRRIAIHRTDCKNIINLPEFEKSRIMPATLELDSNNNYEIIINIYCNNRQGILVDISKIFNENNIDILSIEGNTVKDKVVIKIKFNIKNKDDIENIKKKIINVKNVIDISRV